MYRPRLRSIAAYILQVRLDSDAKKIIKRIKKQAEGSADADGDGATAYGGPTERPLASELLRLCRASARPTCIHACTQWHMHERMHTLPSIYRDCAATCSGCRSALQAAFITICTLRPSTLRIADATPSKKKGSRKSVTESGFLID